jgi:UDP-N-acetylglucosamine 2-epimerase (non-hydrolysing)
VAPEKVFVVGNVMIDTLLRNKERIEGPGFVPSPAVKAFCDNGHRYAVLTLHRPSNVDNREELAPIWRVLSDIGRRIPILFPVHPRTRAKIGEFGLNENGITLVDPVGSLDMLYAVKGAALVLTDSGGLQEETTVLGFLHHHPREYGAAGDRNAGNELLLEPIRQDSSAAAEILPGKPRRVPFHRFGTGNLGRIADVFLEIAVARNHPF